VTRGTLCSLRGVVVVLPGLLLVPDVAHAHVPAPRHQLPHSRLVGLVDPATHTEPNFLEYHLKGQSHRIFFNPVFSSIRFWSHL